MVRIMSMGYFLDFTVSSAGLVIASSSYSPILWHQHLGHPSLGKLRQVISVRSYVRSLRCESCELEKIIVLLFLII